MPQLYHRVPVHDTPTEKGRLPEEEGKYLTDWGWLNYEPPYINDAGTCWSEESEPHSISRRPEWWEEEVDLPTEEEIDKIFPSHNNAGIALSLSFARSEGAKWVINKILNK